MVKFWMFCSDCEIITSPTLSKCTIAPIYCQLVIRMFFDLTIFSKLVPFFDRFMSIPEELI